MPVEPIDNGGAAYATAGELRHELGDLTAEQLPDAAAARLLRTAERLVDRLLGLRPVNAGGRKLTPNNLADWQAEALRDATVLLAAAEHRDPAAFAPAAGGRVKGPDFEVDAPAAGSPAGRGALLEATALLDNANLRVLTARTR